MRHLPTSLLAAAAVAIGFTAVGHADVTVNSDPVGYYRVPLTAGFQTIGMTLIHPPVFVTAVDSSDSDSVTSTDSSVDVGTLLEAGKSYYLEVVDGPNTNDDLHVGHRFEVDETATTDAGTPDGEIALDPIADQNTAFPVPALTGYRVEIRPHVTLAETFAKEPLYANFDIGLADQVQVYNGNSFSAYYLLGSNGEGDQKAWGTYNFQIRDDVIIYPGQGLLYKRSGLAPDGVDLVITGKVRANAFYQTLAPGFNFVAEPFPVTASFTTRDTFPPPFTPNFDLGLADQVQIYNGSSFTAYFLAGTLSNYAWLLTNDFVNIRDDEPIFDFKRSVFIKKRSVTLDYRIPLGWNP